MHKKATISILILAVVLIAVIVYMGKMGGNDETKESSPVTTWIINMTEPTFPTVINEDLQSTTESMIPTTTKDMGMFANRIQIPIDR